MDTVTLSAKYQIVVPRHVRERLKLRPGDKIQVISLDDAVIHLIPLRPIREMRGFLKGLDSSFTRESDEDR
jgi:AbrB family looped-hinge helix DNA binding protein